MTIYLVVNHYECTYYYVNEDPYIYEISDNEREGENGLLEFSFCFLGFSLPFFVFYNKNNYLSFLL